MTGGRAQPEWRFGRGWSTPELERRLAAMQHHQVNAAPALGGARYHSQAVVFQEPPGPPLPDGAFTRVIREDPALTVRLMRFANSAAVGARRTFSNVRDALILLGAERVRQFLLLVLLSELGAGRPALVASVWPPSFQKPWRWRATRLTAGS